MGELLLGSRKEGQLFIISAPAGTGKTTLVKMLVEEFPSLRVSVSYTTRNPREAEAEGIDYKFISKKDFEEKIRGNEFLEYADVYGSYYGTSGKWVNEQLKMGHHVILVIDTQGAFKVKEKTSGTFIFLRPPSMEVLRERLEKRNTESSEVIQKRLAWAEKELSVAPKYDYIIVNDNLGIAYQILRSIVIAQSHSTKFF